MTTIERDYKIELIYLGVDCPECGLYLNITVFSNQTQVKYECKCCGHMLEIKILVCSECNSSKYVVEPKFGGHYCNTCEKLVSEW